MEKELPELPGTYKDRVTFSFPQNITGISTRAHDTMTTPFKQADLLKPLKRLGERMMICMGRVLISPVTIN